LRVLGNQRLTAGGNVRRAKPKNLVSVKKRSQT
jgi:RNA-binding protein